MVFQEASQDLIGLLRSRLPASIFTLLEQAGELAEAASVSLYLVGGAVRDLLLGLENLDLDLVVEGDGVALAEAFAERFGGTVKRHRRFGTATVLLPDGVKVDVATTRTEVYERP
ncbi:MAG: poly(A) polymerase, partial [Candidatus Methylomirabilales bacterium]